MSDERRVYLADLAAYNAGRLRGVWVTLGEDDLAENVAAMIAGNPEAEEYECHDQDGEWFGLSAYQYRVADLEDLDAALTEHGEPLAVFIRNECDRWHSETVEMFLDSYQGEWGSLADFAQELYEDTGSALPDDHPLSGYIDWERVGRDLELSGEFWLDRGFVFRSC